MILSGEKTEEYREVKPYYDSRFRRLFDMDESNNPTGLDEQPILFRNGYSHTSPSFTAICTLSKGEGRTEWGAEPHKQYWILNIQRNPQIGFCTLSEYVLAKKKHTPKGNLIFEIPTINTRPIIHPAMVATTRMRRGRMVPVLHSV